LERIAGGESAFQRVIQHSVQLLLRPLAPRSLRPGTAGVLSLRRHIGILLLLTILAFLPSAISFAAR
jgi:hypothetical protein